MNKDIPTHASAAPAPPEGFEPMPSSSPVDMAMGPWFVRRNPAGTPTVGFRVEENNLNINGVCHGGVIATFADILARVFSESLGAERGKMATITLDIDYLAPGRAGAWIEATPETIKRTGKLLFTQAVILDGEEPIARCKAIYRLFGKPGGTD